MLPEQLHSFLSDNLLQPREFQELYQQQQQKYLSSPYPRLLAEYRQLKLPQPESFDLLADKVCFGNATQISPTTRNQLQQLLMEFAPWRKGPFELFGIEIDSEWRSELKWNRLLPYLDSMQDKVICDIGCNNGYFMWKMAAYRPQLILGLDPTYRFYAMFQLFYQLNPLKNLEFLMLEMQSLKYFAGCFDMIFCMGMVYHLEDPLGGLKLLAQKLKKGGQLILESMTIPGEDSYALFPEKRYGNARGFWFIPSASCLVNWLKRCNFHQIEIHYHQTLEFSEQRRTSWADVDSFKESLNPENLFETREGYPRQNRTYITCRI